jgi:hypothetical protein
VITDLDSIAENSTSKVRPEKGKKYRTGNDTIKKWIPEKTILDEVLSVPKEEKVKNNNVRVAYQYEIDMEYNGNKVTAIPYTFEDALTLTNVELFKGKTASTGLIRKMADAVNKPSISKACQGLFEALGKNSKKAEMALELLFTTEPNELTPPQYIYEGLLWMQEKLKSKHQDYQINTDGNGAN